MARLPRSWMSRRPTSGKQHCAANGMLFRRITSDVNNKMLDQARVLTIEMILEAPDS